MNSKSRILIVEDNPINREAAGMLARLGHSFDIAPDWRCALDFLSRVTYSLVLVDCRMPEKDGYERTRAIRDPASNILNHGVPIIGITAHAMTGEGEKCRCAGMDDYLTQPIRPDLLEQMIERWTEQGPRGGQAGGTPPTPGFSQTAAAAGFDAEELIERLMGNENLARRVAGRFLEDMPRQLLALSQALNSADAESARRVAHSIKGAAANMSVEPVRDLAERLEDLGREGRMDDASELLPELSSTFDAMIPAMRRFCG